MQSPDLSGKSFFVRTTTSLISRIYVAADFFGTLLGFKTIGVISTDVTLITLAAEAVATRSHRNEGKLLMTACGTKALTKGYRSRLKTWLKELYDNGCRVMTAPYMTKEAVKAIIDEGSVMTEAGIGWHTADHVTRDYRSATLCLRLTDCMCLRVQAKFKHLAPTMCARYMAGLPTDLL